MPSDKPYRVFHTLLVSNREYNPTSIKNPRSSLFPCKLIDPGRDISQWQDLIFKRLQFRAKKTAGNSASTSRYENPPSNDVNSKSMEQIQTEYTVFTLMRKSPRIVRLHCLLLENPKSPPDHLFFYNFLKLTKHRHLRNAVYVMEKCNQGSLKQMVEECPLDERKIFSYVCQIVQGLNELKKRSILHRDLRPCNILLHEDQIKFSDFDSSFILGISDASTALYGLEMKSWMPPEIIELVLTPHALLSKMSSSELYHKQQKCDIFYLGVNIYKMLFRREYDCTEDNFILNAIIKQNTTPLQGKLISIMSKCLQAEVSSRISLEQLNSVVGMLEKEQYFLAGGSGDARDNAAHSRLKTYIIEEPLSFWNLNLRKTPEMLLISTNSNSNDQKLEDFLEARQQAFEIAEHTRHTHRYTDLYEIIENKQKQDQNYDVFTEKDLNFEQNKLSLASATSNFLQEITMRIYYYEYLFRLVCDISIKEIHNPIQKQNVGNHIRHIHRQLITLLAFFYQILTKLPFRSDSLYSELAFSYETMKLMRNIEVAVRRREFFIGRKLAYCGLEIKDNSDKLEVMIENFKATKYSNTQNFLSEYKQIKILLAELDGLIKQNLRQSITDLIITNEDHQQNHFGRTNLLEIMILLIIFEKQEVGKLTKAELVFLQEYLSGILENSVSFERQYVEAIFKEYKSTHQQQVQQTLKSQHFIMKTRKLIAQVGGTDQDEQEEPASSDSAAGEDAFAGESRSEQDGQGDYCVVIHPA